MKVLLALDNFSRSSGGAPASARELATALLAAGHRLAIIEASRRAARTEWNAAELRQVRLCGPLLPGDRDLRTLVLNPRWKERVFEAIADVRPELVITQGMLAPGAIEAARHAIVPSAYFFRGYAPLCPEQYVGLEPSDCARPDCPACLGRSSLLKLPLVKAVLRLYDRTIPRANLLVANSRYIAGLLERFWSVRAEVVYPTLNLPVAERPENDPDGPVLFVKPQVAKGLDMVVDLAGACPGRRFAVAGEIRGAAERRLRTRPNIELLGWQTDMPAVYRRSRLLLLPSRLPEPFGRVAAEAAAVGCPTVAYDVGGVAEAAGPGAILLPTGASADEWVQALARSDDPARYEAMRSAAIAYSRSIAGQDGLNRLVRLLADTAARQPQLGPPPLREVGRRLKVVQVISALPRGGAELSTFNLASRLDRERFDVRVICTREEGELAADFRAAGIPVELLKLPSRYSPLELWRLAKRIRELGADIVHTQMRRANTSGRIAAWLARVPVIVAHERNLPVDKTWRHSLVDRLLAAVSSRVIAISPQVAWAEHAKSGIPLRRIAVLTNARDLALFTPGDRKAACLGLGIDPHDFVVGFAARLHPNKRPWVLLRAAAAAAGDVPNLRLMLAGDGPLRGELEALAAELGIAERVTFLGWQQDMPTVYRAMDVLCLPSYIEGYGCALLEALACGIPAIVTPVGFMGELVGEDEAGIVVPVDAVEPVRAALVRLAHEPGTRSRMAGSARRRAEPHGVDAYARRVAHLYLELWAEAQAKT